MGTYKKIFMVEFDFCNEFKGERDIQVIRGMVRAKNTLDKTKDFYYIDTGYLGNSGDKLWHRITKNNWQVLNHLNYNQLKELTDIVILERRFKQILNINFNNYRPKQKRTGKNILIVPPTNKVFLHWNITVQEWLNNVKKKLSEITDRKIIIREKPKSRTIRRTNNKLIDQLYKDDIHCVVTFSSIGGFESIIEGVPAVILGPSAGNYLAEKSLKNIDKPYYADEEQIRQHVFYLSACQFNRLEMTNGYAYKLVEELQGEQKHNEHKILYS